ncbi:MAG: glycosidase, partial [Melioribacteraceae bacterium]|nr:glycosidase [Melioribacteraceae bacterium]
GDSNSLSIEQKLLLGAYFSKEYSIEAAALFNPSIVLAPGSNEDDDRIDFIMGLRATGEGHISSIEFVDGSINNSDITVNKQSWFCETGQITKDSNHLNTLSNLLAEDEAFDENKYLDANYNLSFDENLKLNERVIFPHSSAESMGMEDLRLVKFTDNEEIKYYGTYSAYNGQLCRVQLLETDDFEKFNIRTLHGKAIVDKGMALIPRKINNKYMMIGRQDGENLYFMQSDNLYNWESAEKFIQPTLPHEYIQIGNCGSPIETSEGWILLLHGVGPMRTYVLGACLLDLNNTQIILGYLKEPLLFADEEEREGYVPNVVYTCGAIRHKEKLVIPYAQSDSSTSFCITSINELLNSMKQ